MISDIPAVTPCRRTRLPRGARRGSDAEEVVDMATIAVVDAQEAAARNGGGTAH